ncbi:RNA polymerase sigma factor [Paenibacillus cineris]|uniref:RNA polymerase sigma factor n=1 Tax=Paenibacillus cineris TaxID=237530 RepID=UPI001B159DF5|nr:sigma-70 family RNA polymerase sigma factor [Paenibacillus cineris]GIO63358.1 RNA polymerase [Paenibacillus cineris]
MQDRPEAWLKEIAEGSAPAFDRFYDAFAPMVYRLAEYWMKDRVEAEDVCQEIFIEVMEKAAHYDPERGSVEAWLAVRVRSRAMDRLRQKQRMAALQRTQEESAVMRWQRRLESAELEAFRHLDQEQVRAALRSIPPMQRMALYGSYMMELTHRELAEKMQKPVGTVKSLIRYGIRNLRSRLEQGQVTQAGEGGEPHAVVHSGKWEQ